MLGGVGALLTDLLRLVWVRLVAVRGVEARDFVVLLFVRLWFCLLFKRFGFALVLVVALVDVLGLVVGPTAERLGGRYKKETKKE